MEVLFSNTKPKSKYGEPFFEECFSEKCPVADLKINIENTAITDKWVKCQAVYKAKGNEKYFTLGLFYQNKDFFKLSKKYNNTLLDFKKQSNFIAKTELFPIFVNKNNQVDLTNKTYAYRINMACAYYFIDAVSIEPYRPQLIKSEFKGDIYNYFYSRLKFPGYMATKGIQGDLVASFLINQNGGVDSLQVLQTPSEQLTSEVINVLQQTDGMWKPTVENGKAVSFRYKLVIRYLLVSGKPQNDYRKIKEEALRSIQLFKYTAALKQINKALSFNPYDAELYFIRSKIYTYLNQAEKAIIDHNTATKIQKEIIGVLGLVLGT